MLRSARHTVGLPRLQRGFHSTVVRSDIFDFFRKQVPMKKTDSLEKTLPETTPESTPEAIPSGGTKIKRAKLRVLGGPVDNSWAEQNNGFAVNAFPTRLIKPDLTEAKVTEAFARAQAQILNGDSSLDDLDKRFLFVKDVTNALGVAIPDRVVSTASSIQDLELYYLTKVVRVKFDEKLPDAIYLDPAEFEGTNVTLVDTVAERRAHKDRWARALQEARHAEAARTSELMRKAME